LLAPKGHYFFLTIIVDSEWNCVRSSATLKVLAQKDGKADYVKEFGNNRTYDANNNTWGYPEFMLFDVNEYYKNLNNVLFLQIQNLMNPENGWYDETTDSVILCANIKTDAPQGLK
jgi:hypothetical protein